MVVASHPSPSDARLTIAEAELVRLAIELGALRVGGPLSQGEDELVNDAAVALPGSMDDPPTFTGTSLTVAQDSIRRGADPLGDELIRLRTAAERRAVGAFYTPPSIVRPMVDWAVARDPARVVDAGCGSGRFAAAVARERPDMPIVALDLDPLATLLTRANLSAIGARAAEVIHGDFLRLELPEIAGATAWIGNPPYLRHHGLDVGTKAWAAAAGRRLGHPVSSLAGLHALFFVATALHARPGDFGSYIVSSEWFDTGYGDVIRQLLTNGLGALSLHAFPPRSTAFDGVMTTAVIVNFEAGAKPATIRLEHVDKATDLDGLTGGWALDRNVLIAASRWSPLFGATPKLDPGAVVRLRDIARVHRGQVSGANHFFVLTRDRARELGVEQWCLPAITSAEEILDSGGVVLDTPERKLLLAVPPDVDRKAFPALDRYLRLGERKRGDRPAVNKGYVASRRRPWWNLGPLAPPPIVASYMARRAPVFAVNPDGLVLLNVAHGVWPVVELSETKLADLVTHLNDHREGFRGQGRTYHGGLEKFEPGEMEGLIVPDGQRWFL